MSPELLQRWRGIQIILSAPGQLNHRAIAIEAACDIESHLSELLSALFVSRNGNVSHERAVKELYFDGHVLSSLRKMADVALFLGLITEEHRYDLKRIAELRDKYAHGRTLKQLAEEPELYALITKTHMFRNNIEALAGFDQQAVFMCVKEQLILEMKERLNLFRASLNQVPNVARDA
jgi:hypothetical protein